MKDEQQKKYANSFHLRVYNVELLKSINELMQTGKYESCNELLNCALGVGIEKIYLEFGKRKLLTQTLTIPEIPDSKKIDRIENELAKVRLLEEDMYILMNSVKALTAAIYNVHRANAKGEALSEELLEDYSIMALMPDKFREIEDNMMARFNRNLGRKDKK